MASTLSFILCGELLEAIEKRALACKNFLAGRRQGEPLRSINLGEGFDAAASRRPFDRETIAPYLVDIQFTFQSKSLDAFSAALADMPQRPESARWNSAQLFAELSPGRDFRVLARGELSFWNGPCAEISTAPERTARMHQENRQLSISAPIHQDSGTRGRHRGGLQAARDDASQFLCEPQRGRQTRVAHKLHRLLFVDRPSFRALVEHGDKVPIDDQGLAGSFVAIRLFEPRSELLRDHIAGTVNERPGLLAIIADGSADEL